MIGQSINIIDNGHNRNNRLKFWFIVNIKRLRKCTKISDPRKKVFCFFNDNSMKKEYEKTLSIIIIDIMDK